MAHIEKYVCDQCGVEKGANNHWFLTLIGIASVGISRWDKAEADKSGSKHLCGQACVHKLVDEFLSKQ